MKSIRKGLAFQGKERGEVFGQKQERKGAKDLVFCLGLKKRDCRE